MALLFLDGFDHYVTADITKKWSAVGSSTVISSAAGRRGTSGLRISSTAGFVRRNVPAVASIVVGCSFTPTGGGGATAMVLGLFDNAGGVEHLHLNYNSAGKLELKRGNWNSPTLLGTSATTLVANTAYYIEIKATINDTTGAATVRINGANEIVLTNIDTRNGGNALVDAVVIGDNSFGMSSMDIDDFYICDTSGATNNDFLGDCRIDTLFPNSDGTYSQFTPNSGTVHYSRVADSAPDTTTYVYDGTVGHKDSYQFADLTAITGNIFGVQVSNAALKDDAGTRSVANLVKSGSSETQATAVALSTSQLYCLSVHEQDPATSAAWTQSGVNAAEFGVVVTA